jgi:DNA-binding transcriptional ArsR family regulator
MKRGRPNTAAAGIDDVTRSPVRMRILGWLSGQADPRTKREIGYALSLSNAAVHYHMKPLEKAGLVRLEGTRPGPNSITEKLYSGKPMTEKKEDTMTPQQKSDFYLRYTLDSISEMHREGAELIRADWGSSRFIVGCYGVHATDPEIRKLKAKVARTLREFFEAHKKPAPNTKPVAITFGFVPSSGHAWGATQKVFDMLS